MSHANRDIDVIVYGTVCLDLLWRVEALPPPGGYVEILEESRAIGGEAANTAMALDKWGVKVALIGNPIAPDTDGLMLKTMFTEHAPGLDLQYMDFEGALPTPFCVCMSTPDGQRTMFGHRFADLTATPLLPEIAARARLFTVEPNAYDSGVAACHVAHAAGCTIVPMDYAKEPGVNRISDIVLTSSDHVGRELSLQALRAFAIEVRDLYGPNTIVTNGERGCFVARSLSSNGEVSHVPAFVAPSVVDTTGCGDIFRAGLLYGLIKDWSLDRSIAFGAAAAALKCAKPGGWAGVESVETIEKFIERGILHSARC